MQYYNYADEIVKDYDDMFQTASYSAQYKPGDDDIVNEQEQEVPVNLEEEGVEKLNADREQKAFEEGLKNDSVTLNAEGDSDEGSIEPESDTAKGSEE